MSVPTVAVLGSEGYLGEILVKFLSTDLRVLTFDKAHSRSIGSYDHHRLNVGIETIPEQVGRAGTLVCAAATVPLAKRQGGTEASPIEFSKGVVELALKLRVSQVIYISSSAIYGKKASSPVIEGEKPEPFEQYGLEKLEQEVFLEGFCLDSGISFTSIRPRTIVGDGRGGIFHLLGELMQRNLPLPVVGKGENIYQFIHVSDLSKIIRALVGKQGAPRHLNVGAPEPRTMTEHLKEAASSVGSSSKVVTVPNALYRLFESLSKAGVLPFAEYQLGMYGSSLWFADYKKQGAFLPSCEFSSCQALAGSIESVSYSEGGGIVSGPKGDFSHRQPVKWRGKQLFLLGWALLGKTRFLSEV